MTRIDPNGRELEYCETCKCWNYDDDPCICERLREPELSMELASREQREPDEEREPDTTWSEWDEWDA